VAFDGDTVAVNCCVAPVFTVALAGEIATPVTAIALTVMVACPAAPLPSAAVARTTHDRGKVPPVDAVNVTAAVPSPSVVPGLRESPASQPDPFVHVTFRFVALDGVAVAVSVTVPPASAPAVPGVTDTVATGTAVTVSVEIAE
jgi:hypothetical protein